MKFFKSIKLLDTKSRQVVCSLCIGSEGLGNIPIYLTTVKFKQVSLLVGLNADLKFLILGFRKNKLYQLTPNNLNHHSYSILKLIVNAIPKANGVTKSAKLSLIENRLKLSLRSLV